MTRAAPTVSVPLIHQRLSEFRRTPLPLTNGLLAAAVCLPLVAHTSGLQVLLTLRSSRMDLHKGEISFPGGRAEPGDRDSLATALRETHEEVGIRPGDLEVLGVLDDFVSISGYRVTPHVVYLDRPEYPFRPEAREVEAILRPPLGHLGDPRNHSIGRRPGSGQRVHRFTWRQYVVWGMTGSILHSFLNVCVTPGQGRA